MNSYAPLAGAVLALALVSAGCDDFEIDMGGEKVEAPFHYSYDVQPGAHLDLESFNGSVEIRSWEQNKVDISGVKFAGSTATRDAIHIEANGTPASVSVRVVRPADHHGSMGARFVVRVPRNITLDRITSSNGAIRVEDVTGDVRVKTSNGAVHLTHLKGSLDATTSNGGIDVSDASGRAVLTTSNGHIAADHVSGPVEANSSNGNIALAFEAAPKADVRASTSNSSITIHMPATSGAHVRADTSNGTIDTDFEVTSQGTTSKTHMEGTLNGGGPLLDLRTSNGSIKVLKP